MITEVSPLATVVLDSNGNGQCSVGPPSGTMWSLRLATLATSTATKQPQGFLYRGSASGPLELVDSTQTGSSASSGKVGGPLYYPGQRLWAKWTGGDAGATATLQAYGQQAGRSDPLAASPLGEGFQVYTTSLTVPFGATSGARIVIDGVNGTIKIYDAGNHLLGEIDSTGIQFFLADGFTVAQLDNTGLIVSNEAASTFVKLDSLAEIHLGGNFGVLAMTDAVIETGSPDAARPALLVFSPVEQGVLANASVIKMFGGSNANIATELIYEAATHLFVADESGTASTFMVNGKVSSIDPSTAGNPNSAAVETWHPLPYATGWSDFGGGNQTGRYKLGADGRVYVVGVATISAGASATVSTALPAAYRPSHRIRSQCYWSAGTGALNHLNLNANGVLDVVTAPTANGQIFEFDCSFPVDTP